MGPPEARPPVAERTNVRLTRREEREQERDGEYQPVPHRGPGRKPGSRNVVHHDNDEFGGGGN